MTGIQTFRQALAAGRILIGAGVTFADPLITDALGPSADFIWLDLEHSPMSPQAVSAHLLAGRARGVVVIVRLPGGGAPVVKPVLDSGVQAVVLPQARSADEVRAFVAECRYPPEGARGYGPRVPSDYGRTGGADFAEQANREVMPIAMIETREALATLDDILVVPGLEAVMIGPADLAWSLGLRGQTGHPENLAAIASIAGRARARGLWVGAGMGSEPAFAVTLAGLGAQWLQVGSDYGYMLAAFDGIRAGIRQQLSPEA